MRMEGPSNEQFCQRYPWFFSTLEQMLGLLLKTRVALYAVLAVLLKITTIFGPTQPFRHNAAL
jgi:hypothetical protein